MAVEEMETATPLLTTTSQVSKKKKIILTSAVLIIVSIVVIAGLFLGLGLNKCAKGFTGEDCKECDFEVQVPDRNCQGIFFYCTYLNYMLNDPHFFSISSLRRKG